MQENMHAVLWRRASFGAGFLCYRCIQIAPERSSTGSEQTVPQQWPPLVAMRPLSSGQVLTSPGLRHRLPRPKDRRPTGGQYSRSKALVPSHPSAHEWQGGTPLSLCAIVIRGITSKLRCPRIAQFFNFKSLERPLKHTGRPVFQRSVDVTVLNYQDQRTKEPPSHGLGL
jgi:hypothetical protein